MPTTDKSGSQRTTRNDEDVAEESVDTAATTSSTEAAERREQLDDGVDGILDEIDEVLETNAAEFVQSFVQKGGQ